VDYCEIKTKCQLHYTGNGHKIAMFMTTALVQGWCWNKGWDSQERFHGPSQCNVWQSGEEIKI